jgi:hypothetical protein
VTPVPLAIAPNTLPDYNRNQGRLWKVIRPHLQLETQYLIGTAVALLADGKTDIVLQPYGGARQSCWPLTLITTKGVSIGADRKRVCTDALVRFTFTMGARP